MKHLLSLLVILCLILSGCSVDGDLINEPVTFYYVHEDYQKNMGQVIASEVREASGHREDLSYVLALYSMGPSKEDLKSPLPRNTKIVLSEYTDDNIELQLSEAAQTMSDAEFTLASACIALTCMDLADIQQVTVVCGERNISIQEENLLYHSIIRTPQEEGT